MSQYSLSDQVGYNEGYQVGMLSV